MDKDTRNAIERATQRARKLLEEDFAAQLEGDFDVRRDGAVAAKAGRHLSPRQVFQRERIVAAIEHKRAAGMTPVDAARDYLRDAAFTTFNRFVALKMLEARELVQECITKGEQSAGYREFCGMAPGLPLLSDSAGYRLYIESLFDELSTEVKVLFDRRDPSSVLWPKRATFDQLLEILNVTELARVWAEDETIGWVYQFFNGQDERKKMREESQAPRNSRELAVRNQFFTPRYVVQFLTDNTLGRIWYEMRGTKTVLAERCEYMVRKPDEEFAPRVKKDPRDLRVLDPACGSGHFLLYAFDLLLTIYEEAHADRESPKSEATGTTLAQDYANLDALRKAIPSLILEYNLHGVDIDPRCAQIAQLALWMRAQKACRDFGIGRAERARIRRSNIVVAEPLVTDDHIAKEFVEKLGDVELGRVFTSLVESLNLAGDLGLLLRFETLASRQVQQGQTRDLLAYPKERVRAALERFNTDGDNRTRVRRRMFLDDASHGIGLLEVVERQYDVVLMNPPFGESTPRTRGLIRAAYPYSAGEIGLAFVERAAGLIATGGQIGAITSRNFIANEELGEWRREILLGKEQQLLVLADLGFGVMDDALVFAAAYVVGMAASTSAVFVRLLSQPEKGDALRSAAEGNTPGSVFERSLSDFRRLPGCVLAYHLPLSVVDLFASSTTIKSSGGRGAQGLITGDDFRFLRLWWEVPQSDIAEAKNWTFYAKGGEYQPYWGPVDLVVNWRRNGREIRNFVDDEGKLRSRPQNISLYFREGVTYPERTASDFSPRPLPRGCIFSAKGQAVFLGARTAEARFISGACTRPYKMLLEALFAAGDTTGGGSPATDYRCGAIELMPLPMASDAIGSEDEASVRLIAEAYTDSEYQETSYSFRHCLIGPGRTRLSEHVTQVWAAYMFRCERMFADQSRVEAAVTRHFAMDTLTGQLLLDDIVGPHPCSYSPCPSAQTTEILWLVELSEQELIAEAVKRNGARRQLTKKSYLVDRRLELIAHTLKVSVESVIQVLRSAGTTPGWWKARRVSGVLQFLVGVTFGRHNAEALFQPEEDAAERAFATPDVGRFNTSAPSDGIFEDDEGSAHDLATAVVEALAAQLPGEGVTDFCDELARAFGEDTIRLALSRRLFDFHLRQFSSSRRSAPVYWQLATLSASYSVWLYIHAFSKDTLFRVQNDYAAPKLAHEERRLESLTSELRDGAPAAQRKDLVAQEAHVDELRAFLDEVKRVAPLWNPNLDDGVIINFAPLWRLVPQNKSWQKELKSTWDSICEGKYDWAHLAMHLWPERVVPKCAKDRSLAIAHSLEDVFWVEGTDGKWSARKAPTRSVDELVRERTSPAVKSALKSLLEAPVATGKSAGRGDRRKAAAVAERGEF